MTKLATAPLDELLVSTEFLADPYPILHRMREEDPVHWSDAIGAWMVTRYDDIVPTFRDVSRFSNEGRLAKTVEYLPTEIAGKVQDLRRPLPRQESYPFRSAGSHATAIAGRRGF